MCGIAGVIGEVDDMNQVLFRMAKAQSHRGTDTKVSWMGMFVDSQIGMVHNRMKITDLSDNANQPFSDESTGLTIVLDGKIFNHKELRNQLKKYYTFTSAGHAEVLLKAYHRWGQACLDKLIGIFAFAIYDSSGKYLFLARDRFGVKPLYFSIQKGNLYFASEIKALFNAGVHRRLSSGTWANYFVYSSYGMPYETFWDNVYQLPAGHSLYFDGYSLDVKRWYEFEKSVREIELPESEREITNLYVDLLEESVRYNLEADVPVGINLSGGFDSSLLLGMVHKILETIPMNTYSFYCGRKQNTEVLWADEMVAHTNYRLEQVEMSTKMVEKEARRIIRIQDEPFDGLSSLAYARLFRHAHKRGSVVLCDGHGLDEVWSGGGVEHQATSEHALSSLSPDFVAQAYRPEYPEPFSTPQENNRYVSIFYTALPARLRFNDRVSMAYSTELRKPFLDHRLIEYAFAQPEKLRVRNRMDKWIPRQIAASLLPGNIRLAPANMACEYRQQQWLTEDLSDWVETTIDDLEHSDVSGWFNFPNLKHLWWNFQHGMDDTTDFIWKWINLNMLLSKR